MSSLKEKVSYLGQTAMLSLVLSSCVDGTPKDSRQPTTQLSPIASTETRSQPEVDIHTQIITGLELSGIKKFQSVELTSTYDGITTKVESYLPAQLNEKAVASIYQTVEDTLEGGPFVKSIKFLGEVREIAFGKKPSYERTTVIIPENVTLVFPTQIVPAEIQKRSAYTAIDLETKKETTIIKHVRNSGGYLENDAGFATANLAIEACQQFGLAIIGEANGQAIVTYERLAFSQELLCNSYGLAIASAAIGKSYEEYFAEASNRSLTFGPQREPTQKGDYPYIVLSESEYSRFPDSGNILKS